jgi:invasin-like protein/calcineurin-like phosphoesterase family protein
LGRHKARTHPAAGNHEYNTSNATPYYNYFGAAAGEPGKGYYSFDLGAWHIIVLNSNITRTPSSPQGQWLRADLAAHQNLCTLAYWHHPLYSSEGGSGSGGVTYSSVRPFWDTLYAGGADVVLAGHRHFYERLAPIKPDGTPDNALGIRTFIVGSGGIGGGTVTNVFPASEVRNGSTFGVLKLYLYDDSYAWKFVPVAGQTFSDTGSAGCHPAPGGGGGGSGVSASLSTVTAAPGTISASNGSITSTITVTAKDASGIPVSGATVVLAATGAGNTLTQPAGPTDGSGVATGTLSSTAAGSKTVSVRIGGVGITQTANVTVTLTAPPVGITHTLLTSGNILVNQNVYTTAAIAPAPNTLVTIALLSHRATATISPTVSGGGMASWTLVASVDFDTLNLPHRRLSIYRAMSASPGSGPLTFSYSSQVSNVEWIVSQWAGVETSGVNGAGAIVQSGSNRADAGNGLSVSLAAFGNAANVALGAFGVNSQVLAVTPGSGFTEINEQPANEGTRGDLQTQWAVDRSTINATWTNLKGGALGVELKAQAGP